MTVDTLGLVLRVLVTAASVPEREGGKHLLKKVKQMGKGVSRLHTIWTDGGNDCNPFIMWVMDGRPLDCTDCTTTAANAHVLSCSNGGW